MNNKKCLFKRDIDCSLGHNVIKTRDDIHPVCFIRQDDEKFTLCEHHDDCSWAKKNSAFPINILRERIEPWLTSLFQSEYFSLLAGSGLTTGICSVAGTEATGMPTSDFTNFSDKIKAEVKRSAEVLKRTDGNFEDSIRVANDLLRGLKILDDLRCDDLEKELQGKISAFAKSLLEMEANLVNAEKCHIAFNCLIAFLMSFASRTGSRDRINIFTTNYDRLIEEAADLAGLHLLDRFTGKLAPIFRASRLNLDLHYNPPGIRGEPRYLEGVARFTKLHGSLDWIHANGTIRRIGLPFGADSIDPYLNAPGLNGASFLEMMIYPNSAKDMETSLYPYVELFRDFAAAICRPNSTLVTYGYGFGDDHINRVLRDMLTIPSTHLVIIAYGDPLGRIFDFYNNSPHHDQLTLLLGPEVASIDKLTENYLPKSAIDFATSRMGQILQSRWATHPPKDLPAPDGVEAALLSKEGQ